MTGIARPFESFVHRLRRHAAERSLLPAVAYLSDGEGEETSLDYSELDRAARRVAAIFQAEGLEGERVLLVYPPGLEFVTAFLGSLYAGVIAVPTYPPDPDRFDRTLPRLRSIAADARVAAVATVSSIRALARGLEGLAPEIARARWLATDEAVSGEESSWREPASLSDPSSIAFLQYTSGSTGDPKGVVVSHGNLAANEKMIATGFGHSPDVVIVSWLPLYHDMGLIGTLMNPLWMGGRAVLMPPAAFLDRPIRWLRAVSRFRATTSGGPNFAYELSIARIRPEEREGLDLSSWRVAFDGAEPVRAETLGRFAALYARHGFRRDALYPCYGLAEATLFVTGPAPERRGRPPLRHGASRLVSCGRPWSEGEVAIVDPVRRVRVPEGEVGEIWVRGPHVAAGYWNRPVLSDEVFRARLEGGEGPFLRTGDLGILDEGELCVAGREKDLLIVRGRNHYPQDVERTVEASHPAVRPGCVVAFGSEVEGEERLVVALETRDGAPAGELLAAVREAVLSLHELAPHAVLLLEKGGVPKTTSGKLQRRACREAWLAGRLPVRASWREEPAAPVPSADADRDSLAAHVRGQLALVLSIDPGSIAEGARFESIGLDSARALELRDRLEAGLGIEIPTPELWNHPTLGSLVESLAARLGRSSTGRLADLLAREIEDA